MAPHPNDSLLLARFLSKGDQEAFKELMDHYLPVVYAAALRVTENPALAADVAQDVFLRLAQGPAALMKGIPLVAWLHRSARSRALDLVRAERRRSARELAAGAPSESAESLPGEALTLLDEVIDKLPAADRALVLQRFFAGHSFAEISSRMNLSEDAARMRVQRALEKMRKLFSSRGVKTSAALLASGMATQAATVILPSHLEAGILAKVQSLAPASAGLLPLVLMTTTKKLAVVASVVAITAIAVVVIVNRDPVKTGAVGSVGGPVAAIEGSVKEDALESHFADLEEKYGAAEMEKARALASQASALQLNFLEVEKRDQRSDLENRFGVMVTVLELDQEQAQALDAMIDDLARSRVARGEAYLRHPGKDYRDTVEMLLVADAYSRQQISREEFDEVARRVSDPHLKGEVSTFEVTGLLAMDAKEIPDPFLAAPDLGDRFAALLRPDQSSRYQEIRDKTRDFSRLEFKPEQLGMNEVAGHLKFLTLMYETVWSKQPAGEE